MWNWKNRAQWFSTRFVVSIQLTHVIKGDTIKLISESILQPISARKDKLRNLRFLHYTDNKDFIKIVHVLSKGTGSLKRIFIVYFK